MPKPTALAKDLRMALTLKCLFALRFPQCDTWPEQENLFYAAHLALHRPGRGTELDLFIRHRGLLMIKSLSVVAMASFVQSGDQATALAKGKSG